MVGKEKFKEINRLLNQKLEEKKVLIAVHRGCGCGNIIENTIPAYRAALQMHADMFECDLISSTDRVVYAFHDGYEMRLLRKRRNIKTYTSKEIDAFKYKNIIEEPAEYGVEKFEDILQSFQLGELFNIDRAWDILPEVISLLEKYPQAIHQAIIKTPVKKKYLDYLEECKMKVMYMPIAYNLEEIKTVLAYENINIVGVEMIAKNSEEELFQDCNIQWVKEQGLFCWANAITLGGSQKYDLFGGLDDDMAIKESPKKAWGKLIDKGINVMQTDWPGIMSDFIEKYI